MPPQPTPRPQSFIVSIEVVATDRAAVKTRYLARRQSGKDYVLWSVSLSAVAECTLSIPGGALWRLWLRAEGYGIGLRQWALPVRERRMIMPATSAAEPGSLWPSEVAPARPSKSELITQCSRSLERLGISHRTHSQVSDYIATKRTA
jgi:hypothetical protein